MAAEDLLANEVVAKSTDELEKTDQIRKAVADTYTFVRSREINATIANFTLDHYIDEAKRRIKDARILRSASDPDKGAGTRPSQLDALKKLEQDFNDAFDQAKKIAKNNDAKGSTA